VGECSTWENTWARQRFLTEHPNEEHALLKGGPYSALSMLRRGVV
jgi:hypothetical protein